MTNVDAALVRRKLATIARDLTDLAGLEGLTADAYRADRMRRKATERLVQEVVEAAVDTNVHLLRAAGRATPGDYFSSFMAAGEARILPDALARELAPSAGLRNRLVHEYDEIDDALVLAAAIKARRLYRDYVAAIEQYLREQGL